MYSKYDVSRVFLLQTIATVPQSLKKSLECVCFLGTVCIYVDDANITGSGSGDELQNKTSHLQSIAVCYVNSWINLLDILRPEQTDHHFAGGI